MLFSVVPLYTRSLADQWRPVQQKGVLACWRTHSRPDVPGNVKLFLGKLSRCPSALQTDAGANAHTRVLRAMRTL